jgi:hypothetical protein
MVAAEVIALDLDAPDDPHLLRRLGVRVKEDTHEQRFDRVGIGGELGVARVFGTAEFQPAQCRFASQRPAIGATRGQLVRKRRHHRVVPEFVVIAMTSS